VPRYFTPEEANAALATLRPVVERMVARRRELAAAQERQERVASRIGGNGGGIEPAELAALDDEVRKAADAIAACIEEIQSLGAQVKDLDAGLIDFPALRRGEEVLLCWHLGEDEIRYWHGLEDGFAGRRPLPFDE
jgi:hypothetical protein